MEMEMADESPRLIVCPKDPGSFFTDDEAIRLKTRLDDRGTRTIVLNLPVTIYQLIDGRWEPLAEPDRESSLPPGTQVTTTSTFP
jgi:hypothetical protein